MINRSKVVNFLLHAVFLIAVYILQAMVFPYIPLYGFVPVLLPIAAVGTAVFEGRERGGIFGLFAGMLCDISFNQPLIVFTIVLTITGLIVGALSETVIARGFPSFFICCIAVLLFAAFVQMFSLLFFEKVASAVLIRTALFQTLYSLVFALPTYFAVRALGKSAQI